MLDISISAIKGGFRELYKTTDSAPQGIASEIRPDSGSPYAVGSEAYSISFSKIGLIFTKCKIIRDVLGGSRVGNIAISLLIPIGKTLAGNKIKFILDEILQTYSDRNYIDKDYNLINVYEEWDFVDEIAKRFILNDDINNISVNIQPGVTDAAIIYYFNDNELINYLNSPYLDIYSKYKRIYFVYYANKDVEASPLNALRHSGKDITDASIDLINDEGYTLIEFKEHESENLSINLLVNNFQKANQDKLYKKNKLKIIYSNKYYKPFEKEGSLLDLVKENFLYIDDDNKTITVRNKITFPYPEIKVISFKVLDYKGNLAKGAEVKLYNKDNQFVKSLHLSNEFKGDEIGRDYKVKANIGDNLESVFKNFTPEKQNENTPIELLLDQLTVKLIVIYPNKKPASEFNYNYRNNTEIGNNGALLVFKGAEELKKTWDIEISKKESGINYSCKIKYIPIRGANPLKVKLQSETSNYTITSNTKDGQNNKRTKASMISPWFILLLIVTTICLIFIIYFHIFQNKYIYNSISYSNANEKSILDYVNGNELFLDKLINLQSKWQQQKPIISKPEDGVLSILPGGRNKVDSTAYYMWLVTMNEIDSAIAIRTAINEGDLKRIKSYHFSISQNKFVKAINSYSADSIAKLIGGLEDMNLTAIADSIDRRNKTKGTKQAEEEQLEDKNIAAKSMPENKPETMKRESTEENTSQNNISATQSTDRSIQITQYLKSSNLSEDTLTKYREIKYLNNNIKKCIDLCLKLWSLNGMAQNNYFWMREQINTKSEYAILKDSALMQFLIEMNDTKKNPTPKYWTNDSRGNSKKTNKKTLYNLKKRNESI